MKNKHGIPSTFPVACHTDHIGPGSTFVAIKGNKEDGTTYIPLALEKGATTIVIQSDNSLSTDIEQKITEKGTVLLYVENARRSLAELSAQAVDYPAKKLRIIGITGTKGKTTTVYLVEHLLKEAGYKTARISSVNNAILGTTVASGTLTTPQADYLQLFLNQCVKDKVEWVVLEVAAHALVLARTEGILFDGVIFTNFEREHLEFFGDLDNYFNAKLRIFNQLKPNAPVFVNVDNNWCKKIPSHYPFVKTFGLDNQKLDITALVDFGEEHRLSFTIPWQSRKHRLMCPALIGRFNAYNITGAIGLALELGVPMETIAAALYSFEGVPGRQDRYTLPNGATCIIDYAHTPASYEAVLSVLRLLTHNLIVVFGHGGERDHNKRPLLGTITAKFADLIILTSDNPRSEDPEKIIADIMAGIPNKQKSKVLPEIDRAAAIQKAYEYSQHGSIIAILGKGTEEYQIIGKKRLNHSDKNILLSL